MLLLGLAALRPAAAGQPPDHPLPLYSVAGTYHIHRESGALVLDIQYGPERDRVRYPLENCSFGELNSGAFSLIFLDSDEPLVAVNCAGLTQHEWRLSVFAPDRDRRQPITELRSKMSVVFNVQPDRLELFRPAGAKLERHVWEPGFEVDHIELEAVRQRMSVGSRHLMPSAPVDDTGFNALATHLAAIAAEQDAERLIAMAAPDIRLSFGGLEGVDAFRGMTGEPWFWPEFARILRGGGVLIGDYDSGSLAIFPAIFHTWPDDLDAYEYYYGDGPISWLYAGPTPDAPVVLRLTGVAAAQGPRLPGQERLWADGWVNLCVPDRGCGFARTDQVRSPIDWRALFRRAEPGAPWVLQTFIAGD